MRPSLLLATISAALATITVAALGLTACEDLGIGRKCIIPGDGGVNGVALSSPALECPQRLCLANEDTRHAYCTASCETNEDCKDAVKASAGTGGAQCERDFVCAVATQTTGLCCKKVCICRDDLLVDFNVDQAGQVITPTSCRAPSRCANVQ